MKVLVEGCLKMVSELKCSCLGNQQRAADAKLKKDDVGGYCRTFRGSFDISDY